MIFVIDRHKKPLDPCSEKRARKLLTDKRAVVHRYAPFTIRLKDRLVSESITHLTRVKLDPGSKITGFALLQEEKVILLGELTHKTGIKAALESRRSIRRGRRNRKTRYRKARFLNRTASKKKGWLAPSLVARVQQTVNLVAKIRKLLPVDAISTEHVKFDTQLMENPDISGIVYQAGELAGYEVKEYVLERDGRKCAYCKAENVPLEIEHIVPRARGGSNRVSNLTLACTPCNQKKGSRTAEEFGFPDIQKKVKKSLKDAAAVNATRWRLFEELQKTGLSVECGTGARTKYQRIKHGLEKQHYYDAVCVGASTPAELTIMTQYVQVWKATGRGNRQMMQPDAFGFPRQYRSRKKRHYGFMTGDLVRGRQPKSGKAVVGRMTARADGSFYLQLPPGGKKRFTFTHKNAVLLQRGDGWQYESFKVLS